LRGVAEAGIDDLIRVPLLLTMAIVVYQRDRNQPLPVHRADLYGAFVSMLLEREEAERGTRDEFRAEWIRQHGPQNASYADSLFDARLAILQHLARWQTGGGGNLLAEAVRFVRAQALVPGSLDISFVEQHVEVLLRRTGLLTRVGDEDQFLHATLREYLAAMALVASGPPDEAMLDWIGQVWSDDSWREIVMLALRIWATQGIESSALLSQLAQASEEGLYYAGQALAEGVAATADVRLIIVSELLRRARTAQPSRMTSASTAITVLSRLTGMPGAADGLRAMITDESLPLPTRVDCAAALLRLGGQDGLPLLEQTARDVRVPVALVARLRAAMALGDVDALLALSTGPGGPQLRIAAFDALVGAGDPVAVRPAIALVARDPARPVQLRLRAAVALGDLGAIQDAVEVMLQLIATVDDEEKARIARELIQFGRSDVAAPLLECAASNSGDPTTRLLSATSLAQVAGYEHMVQVIAAIASDPTIDRSVREWAASELTTLGYDALAEQATAKIAEEKAAAASRIRPRQAPG
jgi:hypothetical protein